MNGRLRATTIVLMRTLAGLGLRGGNPQARGTPKRKEGDLCEQCRTGFLKRDRNGILLCSSCGWDERDEQDEN